VIERRLPSTIPIARIVSVVWYETRSTVGAVIALGLIDIAIAKKIRQLTRIVNREMNIARIDGLQVSACTWLLFLHCFGSSGGAAVNCARRVSC